MLNVEMQLIDPSAFAAALASYMVTQSPPVTMNALTDGPRPDWAGPEDDDELFSLMLKAKHSNAVTFGNRCSVDQLFPGDPAVINEFFGGDRSSLDAAVFQHLAFWTGCDQKRMERMARRTIWVRPDKWDDRDDYLPRTIAKACSQQVEVYSRPQPQVPPPPAEWDHRSDLTEQPPSALSAPLKPGIPIQADMYAKFFDGVVHVHEREGVVWSQRHGRFLSQRSFQAVYGRRHFSIAPETSLKVEKPIDSAWEALYRNQHWAVPVADNTAFRPEIAPGALIYEEGQALLNTWVPITVEQVPDDVRMFISHVEKLVPNEHDRTQLIAYMAACAQYPGVKFQWAPLIQGCEGNGKTFLGSCVSHAVGLRYTHVPNASDISNKFNAWIDRKLFIVVEEIYVADRRETLDALKPLITNTRIEIQGKNANQVTGDNRANFMLFTNHKDAWPKSSKDRRVAPFFTAQQSVDDLTLWGMNGNYFPNLWNWAKAGGYAAINHFLHNYRIPDEMNPAGACHRAPDTSSTEDAISESLSPIAREIADNIDVLLGFKGGFVSSIMVKNHLEQKRMRIPSKLDSTMSELGYIRHPGLTDRGRTNNAVAPDGGKPYIYVKENSAASMMRGPAEIAASYERAQVS